MSHMEQWSNVVASRIATTMPRKKESVSHMEQRLRVNDAALEDVPNTLWGEEFASHMALRRNDAASRVAPTELLLRAEFVGRMVKRGREAMQLGIVRKISTQ